MPRARSSRATRSRCRLVIWASSSSVATSAVKLRSNWGRELPGEFQALDYFLSHLPLLGLPDSILIHLRPHPSDAPGKYHDWVAENSTLNVKMDDSLNIARSIGCSSWVAGCESYALVLALLAGRKTYCTLPPWAPPCRLPHKGLIYLRKQDVD